MVRMRQLKILLSETVKYYKEKLFTNIILAKTNELMLLLLQALSNLQKCS